MLWRWQHFELKMDFSKSISSKAEESQASSGPTGPKAKLCPSSNTIHLQISQPVTQKVQNFCRDVLDVTHWTRPKKSRAGHPTILFFHTWKIFLFSSSQIFLFFLLSFDTFIFFSTFTIFSMTPFYFRNFFLIFLFLIMKILLCVLAQAWSSMQFS